VKTSGGDRRALISPPQGLVLSARDSVRIHRSGDSGRVSHKLTFAQSVDSGSSARKQWWISAPEGSASDKVYLIQTKIMSKRYVPVIAPSAKNAHNAGRGPGREKAPVPEIKMTRQEESRKLSKNTFLPEGLYVAVSRPEDLYIVQSSRPEQVMLSLSQKNIKYLLADNKPPLPFKPSEIILTLDPWFPQSPELPDEIKQLVDRGYLLYTLNNPGHLSLFRDIRGNVKLIAGPWLYSFNSWSLSFVASLGVDAFVSPLENNRQNLERTLGVESRRSENTRSKKRHISPLHSKFFITVFAWPPLFNIRANLGTILNFDSFTDNRDEAFSLVTGIEGSRVYPKEPFSIIDKIPFLKEAGFGRFIIDLCGPILKKSNYRDLMRSVKDNAPLPHANRFNWKDGFYTQNVTSSSPTFAGTNSPFSGSE
jgi:putative protease